MPYFLKLNEQKLKYLDTLTYVVLKSFDNPSADCFPSQETIAEKAGLSKDYIIKSIKRLVAAGYISVWRKEGFQSPNKSYPNHYYFRKLNKGDYFFMIPYEILNIQSLTNYEKAMLLCLYQFNITPHLLSGSIKEVSVCLGLTQQTVYKKYNSLVAKGYLNKQKLRKLGITSLQKINWDCREYLHKKIDTSKLIMT